MQLDTTLQSLYDILAAIAPDNYTLKEKGNFYKSQSAKAMRFAAAIDKAERARLKEKVIAHIRVIRPRLDDLHSPWLQIQGLMEQDLDHISIDAEPTTAKMPYELHNGHTAAPTAFLRSALFTNPQSGQQIFRVIGLPNIRVERAGAPLTKGHLQALLYLISLVRDYDIKNGQTVAFNPWDAVRTIRWTKSSLSLRRLITTLEALQEAKVRIVHDLASETQESAPLVGRVLCSMDDRKKWEVQLPATLLTAVAEYRTFLNFETLAALPGGTVFWLYAFIKSEGRKRTEWDVDEIAEAAGLTSKNRYHVRENLKIALDTLVDGKVEIKARGKAVQTKDRGILEMRGKKLVVKSLASTTRAFPPPLKAYEFRRTATGKDRLVIHRSSPVDMIGICKANAK